MPPHGPGPQEPSVELNVLLLFIEHLLSVMSGVLFLALNTYLLLRSKWAQQWLRRVPLWFSFQESGLSRLLSWPGSGEGQSPLLHLWHSVLPCQP